MLERVNVVRAADSRYDDLLDVVEHLMFTYGTAANALAQMAMQSDLFREGLQSLQAKREREAAANRMERAATREPSTVDQESVPPERTTNSKAVA